MNFVTCVVALVGFLANAGLATDGMASPSYTNGVATSILEPQELGTMTSAGYLVYNMNICSVVQQTLCETSTSTGTPVAASTISSSTSPYETPTAASTSATTPGASTAAESSTDEVATSTDEAATGTYPTAPSGTMTGSTPSVTTGAASGVQVPNLALGLAGILAGILI